VNTTSPVLQTGIFLDPALSQSTGIILALSEITDVIVVNRPSHSKPPCRRIVGVMAMFSITRVSRDIFLEVQMCNER
jgi:hypothetical protein